MLIFNFLKNLFLSGFAGGIVKTALDFFAKRTDADIQRMGIAADASVAVIAAQLQAEMAANDNRRQLAAMYFGWGPTRWLIWFALAAAVLHQSLVLIDSSCPAATLYLFRFDFGWFEIPGFQVGGFQPGTGGCGWGIPKAPAPYDEREWLIIATLLGIQKVPDALNGMARVIQSLRGR